jgi:phenylacetic acid degradation operon negative regulatory protein
MHARSLALSILLGSHPPRLPVAALVSAGELFGVSAGAMRTALSRMASAGEVTADGGRYALAGSLLDRQARQDTGRRPVDQPWDRTWVTVTPLRTARPLAERRDLRRRLEVLRLGELRPDYWLRPANIELEPLKDLGEAFELIVAVGSIEGTDRRRLIDRLWSPENLAKRARELGRVLDRLTTSAEGLPADDVVDPDSNSAAWLVSAFFAAADVVRFLTREPRLPEELVPSPWEPNRLRVDYDRFEQLFQHRLSVFFRMTGTDPV